MEKKIEIGSKIQEPIKTEERQKLEKPLEQTAFGTKRKVIFEGINSMSFEGGFANIVWLVYQYDNDGNLIESRDLVQGRRVVTPISNQERVDKNGIKLAHDSKEWEFGIPQFDFYWKAIQTNPLPLVLNQAAIMLESQGVFN